jgi:hypothetical protein
MAALWVGVSVSQVSSALWVPNLVSGSFWSVQCVLVDLNLGLIDG